MKKKLNRRREARGWMFVNGIRPTDIQRQLNHKYISPTTDTLSGIRNDRKVLRRLLELGCPPEYLKLPDDMRGQCKAILNDSRRAK